MSYSVRRASRDGLREVLTPIWSRNLQIRAGMDLHERFRWNHEQNPCGPPETFLLEHDAEKPRSIVGSSTIFRRPLAVFGQDLVAGNLGDVAVDRAHRTLFPALCLQRAVRDYSRENLALLYAFPNELARPLYERLKLATLGRMVRYARPLRLEENVPDGVPFPRTLRRIASWGDRAIDLWESTQERLSGEGGMLGWDEEPDGRFDDLWQRGRHRVTLVGRRDRDSLRWRFRDKPGERFEFATLEFNGQLEAYAVIQLEEGNAQLRDLFASDDAQLHRLIHALLPVLRARQVRSVTLRFLGAPWLVDLLVRHGFRAREDHWVVVVDPGQGLPIGREALLDANNWYLTDFDEDT